MGAGLLALPKIKTWNTKNGAKVLFVHANQIPLIDIRVIFRAGSARDGAKPGLAALANRLMPMGADGKTAGYIADQFESVGAKQGNGARRDSAWISLRSLSASKVFDKSLVMLSKIIKSPDFNEKDLDRERKRVLIGLKQQEQSPAAIAKKRFFKEIYGNHPYAHLSIGTEEGVKSITRADVIQFYKQFYVQKMQC